MTSYEIIALKAKAKAATFPDGYRWGTDALEHFAVGKHRAWEAIEPEVKALLARIEELEAPKIAEHQMGDPTASGYWRTPHGDRLYTESELHRSLKAYLAPAIARAEAAERRLSVMVEALERIAAETGQAGIATIARSALALGAGEEKGGRADGNL